MRLVEDIEGQITEIPWHDSILDMVRERPAMYMGSKSLTGLHFFLSGIEIAKMRYGIDAPSEIPRGFADWVGYRLHLGSNCNGFWPHAILSRVRDEIEAVDLFYELRDEFLRREPRVIATVRKDRREYYGGRRRNSNGVWEDFNETLPESLKVVIYTEDPGFFLVSDEAENFFYNGWFFSALDHLSWRMCGTEERFVVQDENTWLRLLMENKKYKRNLAKRRARIQQKRQAAKAAGTS